jgi:hypothetical protein
VLDLSFCTIPLFVSTRCLLFFELISGFSGCLDPSSFGSLLLSYLLARLFCLFAFGSFRSGLIVLFLCWLLSFASPPSASLLSMMLRLSGRPSLVSKLFTSVRLDLLPSAPILLPSCSSPSVPFRRSFTGCIVLYFLWFLVSFCLFCHLVWLLHLSPSSIAPYHLFLPSAVTRPICSARWVHAICPTSCALQMASFLLVGCFFVVSTHLIWIGFLACRFPRFVSLAFFISV